MRQRVDIVAGARGRPSEKRREVVADLVRRIVSGEFPPGASLPSRKLLIAEHKTGPVTIQDAFDELVELGFVRTIPGQGSLVAERPPHLHRIAVILPKSNSLNGQYFKAFKDVPRRGIEGVDVDFDICLVSESRGEEGSDDSARLLHAASVGALKGIISASQPTGLDPQLTLLSKRIPLVAITSGANYYAASQVKIDIDSFAVEAVACLKKAGVRSAAIFCYGHELYECHLATLLAHAAAAGIETRPEWTHGFEIISPRWARNVATLLFNCSVGPRPEALVICDDNLVASATQGLLDAGVDRSGGLTVVAHANFPMVTPSAVSAWRIGFDVPKMLAVAADMIDRLRPAPTRRLSERVVATIRRDGNKPENTLMVR